MVDVRLRWRMRASSAAISAKQPLSTHLSLSLLLSLSYSFHLFVFMVLTPDFGPVRQAEPCSPLLLATTPRPPSTPRRTSTGNYSQLSDFRLDSNKEIPEIRGVRHVNLSINSAYVMQVYWTD